MASEIERPRNCGECRRMFHGAITVNGKRYAGGCPEFAHPVMRDWICHPNVGIKKEAK